MNKQLPADRRTIRAVDIAGREVVGVFRKTVLRNVVMNRVGRIWDWWEINEWKYEDGEDEQ